VGQDSSFPKFFSRIPSTISLVPGVLTMSMRQLLVLVFLAGVACIILALPVPDSRASSVLPVFAITFFTIGLWATGVLQEYLGALIFFVLAMMFAVAPPDVVFSGFASTAFWLVFGGVIMGSAAEQTGLGRYLGAQFLRRVGGSYARLILGIVAGAIAISLLIPTAMGRLMLLMPIVFGLADKVGFESGSNGRRGMVVALVLGSIFAPLTILPANVPNAILAGAAESLHGITITYGTYLLMNFPVNGLLKSACMVGFILLIYPARTPDSSETNGEIEPLSSEGKRLALILLVTLFVWATDFLHGISPGWVAAASGIICLLPGVGVVPPDKFRSAINVEILFYIAGVLGLGNIIASSGAGGLIVDNLLSYASFSPETPLHSYAVFSGAGIVMQFFATLPGTIVIMAPFADTIAAASGIPVLTVLMMHVNAFTTVFFPYQTAPILVGVRLGRISVAEASWVMVPLALLSIIALLPLNYLWWKFLGYIH